MNFVLVFFSKIIVCHTKEEPHMLKIVRESDFVLNGKMFGPTPHTCHFQNLVSIIRYVGKIERSMKSRNISVLSNV